jgi:alpha-mannosidase
MTDYTAPAHDLPVSGSPVTLVTDSDVVITAFKKAYHRDTLIVRLHNRGTTDAQGMLKVGTTAKSPSAAYETTLEECRLRALPLSEESVAFTLRPAGLLTLEFEMSNR